MTNATLTDVIKLTLTSSPAGDVLVGTAHEVSGAYYGGAERSYYLGESYPVRPGAALTQALRDFSLTTARAPGDWPTTSAFAPGPVRI